MLSLIIPTYNEAEALPMFVASVAAVLCDKDWEMIVVDDDSPDGTWNIAEGLREKYPMLRVIRRQGKRGLSSAVTDGFAAAMGNVLAVMDADGQHDPSVLPKLAVAVGDGATAAIASRYAPGGSTGEWAEHRRILSRLGTQMARMVAPYGVTDPLSGFFAVDAAAYKRVAGHIRPEGFKILLEILAALPRNARIAEEPLQFRPRTAGASKLSVGVQTAFVRQLLRLLQRAYGRAMSFWLFIGICVLITALLIPRAWALSPLYTQADVRRQAEAAIRSFADDEGLPLSEVLVQRVTFESVEIIERHYRRGTDERHCRVLRYDLSPPRPCAD